MPAPRGLQDIEGLGGRTLGGAADGELHDHDGQAQNDEEDEIHQNEGRTAVLVTVLSLPCALGFNVLAGITIPGIGDIQSIEDFIVSNNLLPLGSLLYVVFCVSRKGWGWDNFLAEADAGTGMKFPRWARGWLTFGLPALIIIIFIMGYVPKIMMWAGLA